VNAAILATQVLAGSRPDLREAVTKHRAAQAEQILLNPDPSA
jgi:phosphoribosylcarboxyaminoimidazole (NCAIR) mutase